MTITTSETRRFRGLQWELAPPIGDNGAGKVNTLPESTIGYLADQIDARFTLPGSAKGGLQNLDRLRLLGDRLPVTVVLCPLYLKAGGFVTRESGLTIEDSRIGIKWREQEKMLDLLGAVTEKEGLKLDPRFTFADRGVIVPESPNGKLASILAYHQDLYQSRLDGLFPEGYQLDTFTSLTDQYPTIAGDYPRFIIPDGIQDQKYVQSQEPTTIAALQDLVDRGLVESNDVFRVNPAGEKELLKRVRNRLRGLVKFGGYNLALEFVRQYHTFNNALVASNPEHGLHTYFERVDYLLTSMNTLARRSPAATNPRVEVLCK